MIRNWLDNWKTTSAGLVLIVGAVVHLIFQIRGGHITENDIMLAIGAILGGVGMLAAGDASKSKKDVAKVDSKVDQTAEVVRTGDTSQLPRSTKKEAADNADQLGQKP